MNPYSQNNQYNQGGQSLLSASGMKVVRPGGYNINSHNMNLQQNINSYGSFGGYQNYPSQQLGHQNYYTHSDKQGDFNQRQQQYNDNIISQSNRMKSLEEDARNVDRLNRINNEQMRNQYKNKMASVKEAQGLLGQAKNSNSVYDQPNRMNTPQLRIESDRQTLQFNMPQPEFRQQQRPAYSQSAKLMRPNNPPTFGPPVAQSVLPPAYPVQPIPMQMPMQLQGQPPFSFGMPPAMNYGQTAQFGGSPYKEKKDKSIKKISSVIEKQNDMISNLMNKLNQPQQQQPIFIPPQRDNDDPEKYLRLFQAMGQMRNQQPTMIIPPNNDNGSNNMLVSLLFQQQMMQVLMHNQAMQNQNNHQQAPPQQKLSALELMLKQEREERLENAIKQLILQKGGNMDELQKKLDLINGRQQMMMAPAPVLAAAKPKKNVRIDSDDDDDDGSEDLDDDDDDDEEALKRKEAERKRKIFLSGLAKVKRVYYRNVFAFLFLNSLKKHEEERFKEIQASIVFMQQIQKKTGLIWAVEACDKGFALMRAKPKESYEIIKDVDKLKANVLEQRVTGVCQLTQAILEGLEASLSTMPAEISKYNAVYFQEKSYLPTARPWEYQMADKRVKDDEISITKLTLAASIIYHIFFEYLKKTVQPIQNNLTDIPEARKPVPSANTAVYELGGKDQPEKGTRYNLVTGLLDYNALLVIWTQKADWRNQMLEKIKSITQYIADKGTVICDEANELERLDNIKAAQEDHKLLPVSVRKTNFDTVFLPQQ